MNITKFNNDAYKYIEDAVDLISNAVKVTLGPKGKNVLIINNFGDTHLTKDGITVAKSIKSDDPVTNGIINIVREASANTAKQAGDGSTTSLVLTQVIVKKGLNLIRCGHNPTFVKQGMQKALQEVLSYIDKHTDKITLEDERLKQIAYISANNDRNIGDLALEAVIKANGDGVCRIEDSKSTETTIKYSTGLTFNQGYISPHFRTGKSTTVKYENALVFVSSIELSNNTMLSLMKHAKAEDKPIIVIAPDFNEAIFTSMYKNHLTNTIRICPIKTPGFAGNRNNWLEDITTYAGCSVYGNNSVSPIGFVGTVSECIIGAEETTLINKVFTPECIKHLDSLKARLQDDITEYEKDIIHKRISTITGSVVTIYVGATTELELKEKKDRIEDAVCALQSALKEGIVEGGGMLFTRCSNEYYDKCKDSTPQTAGYNVVMAALLTPFIQLCTNSDVSAKALVEEMSNQPEDFGYNFKSNKWENLKNSGVIDPALVLKQSITNAVGIASNLLTTVCISYYDA